MLLVDVTLRFVCITLQITGVAMSIVYQLFYLQCNYSVIIFCVFLLVFFLLVLQNLSHLNRNSFGFFCFYILKKVLILTSPLLLSEF